LLFSFVDLSRDLRVNSGIMAIEFSTALGLLKTITGTTRRLADAREEAKINEVAIQLQGIVLDLQSEMMIIQSDYQSVLRAKEDLDKKLIEQQNWHNERARYQLKKVGDGVFVYALKDGNATTEPAHWLCAHCYEDQKRSILQRSPYPTWLCPRCKTKVVIADIPEGLHK
jgi:hypothetical protein